MGNPQTETLPKASTSKLRKEESGEAYRAAGPGPTQTDPDERFPSTAQRATDRAPTEQSRSSPTPKEKEKRAEKGGKGRVFSDMSKGK